MTRVYTAAGCRELDRLAIEDYGIPGFTLMRRAGEAAFHALIQRWPDARRVTVYCGKGNNAGDGYIIAGLAREYLLDVTLIQLGDAATLRGDAARARDWALQRGVEIRGPGGAVDADVVVDALLGTGLAGAVREPFASAIDAINASRVPVLAVDVPSGVSADSGAVLGTAVGAELTVTFIGHKLGLHTGPALDCRGDLVFADLGVPSAVLQRVGGWPLFNFPALEGAYRLPRRAANAYKQALGHVAVVGGDGNMGGAPIMAAEAALRTGAGMVTMVTRAAHRPAVLARRPEVMVADADDADQRRSAFDRATCLVVGPGLGRTAWAEALLKETLALGKPMLLDADALNLLAELDLRPSGPVVVTPHAGEAARLLGIGSGAVQDDRPRAVLGVASRVNGVAVLKGAGSLIAGPVAAPGAPGGAEPQLLGVCAHGNPGMATAGMGDVLSGVIGGCLAQGLEPAPAAVIGTCLHSYAGDLAAGELGQRSLLATDLLPHLVRALAREDKGGP